MKKKTLFIFISSLLFSSLVLFALHFYLFHDLHHLAIYTIHDLAFLPIEVLIVSLFLHRIIESDQKNQMLEKMNIAVGTFFSEGGTSLLEMIVNIDRNGAEISESLLISANWKRTDYKRALREIEKLEGDFSPSPEDIMNMKDFLQGKRGAVLRFLENPNLMEHECFTDLLWAVFHLTEELIARHDFDTLPSNDVKHLFLDIMRVYRLLIREWLKYMENLQKQYPYLFSMAIRTNPLDKKAKVVFS